MSSILFLDTGSHDITTGITHILLERGRNCFFYHLVSTPVVISVLLPYTLAQVFVARLSTKGSRVAMLRFMVALLMTVALAEGHMCRTGP